MCCSRSLGVSNAGEYLDHLDHPARLSDDGLTMPEPADDFPERSWLEIVVPKGDVPRAIRLRSWLKQGLRAYGIRVKRVSGQGPEQELETEGQAGEGSGP